LVSSKKAGARYTQQKRLKRFARTISALYASSAC